MANVEYLVVGGGGGAGGDGSGGGGAGRFRTATGFPVTNTAYSVTVGAGGAGINVYADGNQGASSIFDSITSIGGAGSGAFDRDGLAGGLAGGGGGGWYGRVGGTGTQAGGNGETPRQGLSANRGGGGGGGSSSAGGNATTSGVGGGGGGGTTSSISGVSVTYAGGGGGGAGTTGGAAGSGGGGAGAGGLSITPGANGAANTGGGGGGGRSDASNYSASGGSGIVIIRYLTSDFGPTTSGGTKTVDGTHTVHTFTSSGTMTFVAPSTGFKQATVNAADVPATQTDFPSYIDLSRVGITTLAEAQGVRVYSDFAKTTELAREIVSATEMHVKIPSLTSTTTIYIDWDDTRADYAVTATYGRNAVWSDYASVYHLEGNGDDSKANTNNGTNSNGVFSTGNGKIKQGVGFTTNSRTYRIATTTSTGFPVGSNSRTVSAWGRYTVSGGEVFYNMYGNGGATGGMFACGFNNNAAWMYGIARDLVVGGQTHVINTWYLFTVTYDGTTTRIYRNGSLIGSGTPVLNTGTVAKTAIGSDNDTWANVGTKGNIDEVRITTSARSANWITTEYNNQNDEATFWGTWTDAGGGGGANTTNFFFMT